MVDGTGEVRGQRTEDRLAFIIENDLFLFRFHCQATSTLYDCPAFELAAKNTGVANHLLTTSSKAYRVITILPTLQTSLSSDICACCKTPSFL